MENYIFVGVVLPERAQISANFGVKFQHLSSGKPGDAHVSIILNQVSVVVKTEEEWNIFDLRNVVANIVRTHLAIVGYLKGYAYDFKITRVLNEPREIDFVFGIEIPCIAKRRTTVDMVAEVSRLKEKTSGPDGIHIVRCLNDLIFAMHYADDTDFYCYRAIESLRHHCAAVHNIFAAERKTQWKKFEEVSGYGEAALKVITNAATSLRHGDISSSIDTDREKILTLTWDVVDSYLAKI